MRLKFLQQKIRRDLKDHIGHIEQRQGNIGLVTFQFQVLGQAKSQGVANVDTAGDNHSFSKEPHVSGNRRWCTHRSKNERK